MSETLVLGSAYRFQGTFTKNNSPWDLTGLTVVVRFRRPDATEFDLAATATQDGSEWVAYADGDSDTLDQEGSWSRTWEVTEGGEPHIRRRILFRVEASP